MAPARSAISALALLVLSACNSGERTIAPIPVVKPLTIVSGANVTDTIETWLVEPLVVEVRVNGVLRPRVMVLFNSQFSTHPDYPLDFPVLIGSTTSVGSFFVDSTDASGRVKVRVFLNGRAGQARVSIFVPETGATDTAKFTVLPGNPVGIALRVRDTAIIAGASYNIGATAADRYGNSRSTSIGTFTSVGPGISVDAAGRVTANGTGRAHIVVKEGAHTDTARVSVVPDAAIVGMTVVDDHLCVATARLDGSARVCLAPGVSYVMRPRWNRAGTHVVYHGGDQTAASELYIVDKLGARTTVSVGAGPTGKYFPTFSADGQQIFFTAVPPSLPPDIWQGSPPAEIWRTQLDGSGATKLTTSLPREGSAEASASPDGKTLVFAKGLVISTLDLSTNVVRSLGVRGMSPSFSPDGTKILFLALPGGPVQVRIMRADGSGVRALPGSNYLGYDGNPNWSPDGAWIIAFGDKGTELIRVSDGQVLPLSPGFRWSFRDASFKP